MSLAEKHRLCFPCPLRGEDPARFSCYRCFAGCVNDLQEAAASLGVLLCVLGTARAQDGEVGEVAVKLAADRLEVVLPAATFTRLGFVGPGEVLERLACYANVSGKAAAAVESARRVFAAQAALVGKQPNSAPPPLKSFADNLELPLVDGLVFREDPLPAPAAEEVYNLLSCMLLVAGQVGRATTGHEIPAMRFFAGASHAFNDYWSTLHHILWCQVMYRVEPRYTHQ